MFKNSIKLLSPLMITFFVIILSLSNALTGCSVRSPMARVVGGLEAPFHRFEPNNVEFKKFKKSEGGEPGHPGQPSQHGCPLPPSDLRFFKFLKFFKFF